MKLKRNISLLLVTALLLCSCGVQRESAVTTVAATSADTTTALTTDATTVTTTSTAADTTTTTTEATTVATTATSAETTTPAETTTLAATIVTTATSAATTTAAVTAATAAVTAAKTEKTTAKTEKTTAKTEKTTAKTTTTTAKTTTTTTTTTEATTTTAETAPVPPAVGDTVEINGKQYVMTLYDEFEGDKLDGAVWAKCPEWKRQDLENYWDDDMSYLDGDGHLVIGIKEENGKYLSGGIRSKGLFEQTYGYFEICCDINNAPGWWTAFWLMGETVTNEENGGVDGTEIDIYESPYFNTQQIQNTLNWDGYGAAHKYEGTKTVIDGIYSGYHTFAVDWTPEEYIFYIDGAETWRTKGGGICENPLYIKITGETGSWAGKIDSSLFPDYMYVDYVKVYAIT